MRILLLFSLLISIFISCGDSDPCEDHTSGYDPICGCPGDEVGFAGYCFDLDLIYFGGPKWLCGHDSIALAIDINTKEIHNAYFDDGSSGHFPGWFVVNSLEYDRGNLMHGEGCQNYPGYNGDEGIYWRFDNIDEIENFPNELNLTGLLIKGFFQTEYEILDSTKVTLYKDLDRK